MAALFPGLKSMDTLPWRYCPILASPNKRCRTQRSTRGRRRTLKPVKKSKSVKSGCWTRASDATVCSQYRNIERRWKQTRTVITARVEPIRFEWATGQAIIQKPRLGSIHRYIASCILRPTAASDMRLFLPFPLTLQRSWRCEGKHQEQV